jgi:hypothetical protein
MPKYGHCLVVDAASASQFPAKFRYGWLLPLPAVRFIRVTTTCRSPVSQHDGLFDGTWHTHSCVRHSLRLECLTSRGDGLIDVALRMRGRKKRGFELRRRQVDAAL